jgi:hypothetical protein
MLRTTCCFVVVILISVFQVQAQEMPVKIGESIVLGAVVTQPQIVNGSFTFVWGYDKPHSYEKFLHLEPGLMGGKLALGIGGTDFLHLFSLRATYLRTWWEPWGAEKNANYGGLEFYMGVHAPRFPIKLGIGVFRLISEQDTEHDWIFSWGVGWGL